MPRLNIQLDIKPKNIHVGAGDYIVSVFLEEEFIFQLPDVYENYDKAKIAMVEYMHERLY
jgi:hypothetical protein